MGIYSTIFKETELSSVQDPENPGVDLDQIEKDIAGPQGIEAHAEEIEDAVEGVVGDPLEEMSIIVYESEYNFNQIMRCIGLNEVAAASKGREFIFEAEDKEGFFKKVKDALIAAFKKVTELFKKVLANIATGVGADKKFVKMYAKQIEAGAEVLAERKDSEGKPFTFKHYNIDKLEYKDMSTDWASSYPTRCERLLQEESVDASEINAEARKDEVKQLFAIAAKTDGIEASDNYKSYAEKLAKKLYGEKKVEVKPSAQMAKDIIAAMGGDSEVAMIKKAYSDIKKTYDKALKSIDAMKAAERKAKNKNSMAVCSFFADMVKYAANVNKTRYGVYLKAAKTKRNQNRAAAAAMKAAAPAPNKESVDFGGAFAGLQLV